MSKEQIRCRDCEFLSCKGIRLYRAWRERLGYYCEHRDQEHIRNYFNEHRLKKMPGFVCYNNKNYSGPAIKTSPAWCPKKRKRTMKNERQ